jgi:excisionase family DNA binding protein
MSRSIPSHLPKQADDFRGDDDVTIAPHWVLSLTTKFGLQMERLEERLAVLHAIVSANHSVKEWYTTAEFAHEVNKAEFTVRTWCCKGRLRATKTENGREWRIPRSELERYRRQGLLPTA